MKYKLDFSFWLPVVILLTLMMTFALFDPLQSSPAIALVQKTIFFIISTSMFIFQANVIATREHDWLTGLRFRIVTGLGLGILSQIPPTHYQLIKLQGEIPNQFLASLTTYCTNMTPIILVLILVWFFLYRRDGGK